MSKADDIFYREFGVVILALFLFVLIVFFAARAIGAHSFEMMKNTTEFIFTSNQILTIGSTTKKIL